MAGVKITKRVVDGEVPGSSDRFVWDNELKGFGLRIHPGGLKTFVVKYRVGGGRTAPTRRVTVGKVGVRTVEEARREALKILAAAASGEDPGEERAEQRRSLSVADLAERFMDEHVAIKRKETTRVLYRGIIDTMIRPDLGTKRLSHLARADVARFHNGHRRHPYQANRALAVLSSMFTWGETVGLVPEGFNPARRIERYPEAKRERFLTDAEIERLGTALREAETIGIQYEVDETGPKAKHAAKPENRRTVFSPHITAAVRLLLFTGARLREILHLRWEHVDLGRGLLLLPDSKTGAKTIVLSAPAMLILQKLDRVGPYVVPGLDPEKPRHDLKKPWNALIQRADLQGLRIHDLRHSFASVGAGAGMGLPIIGKLLGHSQAATTARYAHLDASPQRRVTNAIGAHIANAMGEAANEGTAEVLPMRRG